MFVKKDLTSGPILKQLTKLALPIMATSFINMAYNLTDMAWIGRVGSNAVASVGIAGFFLWFANAFSHLTKISSEVTVSQSIGKRKYDEAGKYTLLNIFIAFLLGLIFVIIVVIFKSNIVSVFHFDSKSMVRINTLKYLTYVTPAFLFVFLNPTFTGVFNGMGQSTIPFYVNAIGLIFNMVLDPILIFGVGIFPKLGIAGAALATFISQAVVCLIFIFLIFFYKKNKVSYKLELDRIKIHRIFVLGTPIALSNSLFCIFSIILGRIVSQFGALPLAVQSVGSQIESISWMTGTGLATALSAFVGQNFGAKKTERIQKGYSATIKLSFIIGGIATLIFMVFGENIFYIFVPEVEAAKLGGKYLFILGISQIFMLVEITTSGAFTGIGKTQIPSIVSILLTGSRIPLSFLLIGITSLGVFSVWWSLTVTSIFKGIIVVIWFMIVSKKINFHF